MQVEVLCWAWIILVTTWGRVFAPFTKIPDTGTLNTSSKTRTLAWEYTAVKGKKLLVIKFEMRRSEDRNFEDLGQIGWLDGRILIYTYLSSITIRVPGTLIVPAAWTFKIYRSTLIYSDMSTEVVNVTLNLQGTTSALLQSVEQNSPGVGPSVNSLISQSSQRFSELQHFSATQALWTISIKYISSTTMNKTTQNTVKTVDKPYSSGHTLHQRILTFTSNRSVETATSKVAHSSNKTRQSELGVTSLPISPSESYPQVSMQTSPAAGNASSILFSTKTRLHEKDDCKIKRKNSLPWFTKHKQILYLVAIPLLIGLVVIATGLLHTFQIDKQKKARINPVRNATEMKTDFHI